MTIVYPGSFDPVTVGHVDIACRALGFASRVIVAVLDNPSKQSLFSVQERVSFLREVLAGNDAIEVDSFRGMLVDYAFRKNANAILRGVRNSTDFEYEGKYAIYNAELSHGINGHKIETIFIPATPALTHVSASAIREAAAMIYPQNLDDSFIAKYVPASAHAALQRRYKQIER
ncbi:MAG: pantetheine-phosphate adenylyltransferase [Defluviitaleaceae bacterium]|nr:pantetheine-phosphate adenylyltransferase [Defluviitaleaceae bacterium]